MQSVPNADSDNAITAISTTAANAVLASKFEDQVEARNDQNLQLSGSVQIGPATDPSSQLPGKGGAPRSTTLSSLTILGALALLALTA